MNTILDVGETITITPTLTNGIGDGIYEGKTLKAHIVSPNCTLDFILNNLDNMSFNISKEVLRGNVYRYREFDDFESRDFDVWVF